MVRKLSPLPLLLIACAGGGKAGGGSAESAINADSLMATVRVLSSDEFEGRAPGTIGEEKTVAYLTDRFKALGLVPGNPDGSWVQNVEMVGISSTSESSVSVGGKTLQLKFPEDIVVATLRHLEQVEIPSSDIVFVGYGIEAPEYGWDDFKGAEVKGKTLIMLVNDPPLPDSAMFRGVAMTYYGRWTYKYEQASAKGAAAAILVHETGPAGYPWDVVVGSRGRENIDIARENKNAGRVPIEGWIQLEKARELFKAAGEDFDALHKLAATKEFKPVALKAKAHFRVTSRLRQFSSRNVVAKLEGSDPALKDEYVIYSAHWDHLGRDTTRQGDQIFNGALDNASGTAGLLEIAKAFKTLNPAPRRSILFLAVTAEEKGLLGAKYYAENPLYPLNRTLADINMDGVNQWGKTSDITVIGLGNSTLDDVLREIATPLGRTLRPDPEPEKGYFYRSDHFEFAKQGVPALYTGDGIEYIGKPPGYGEEKRAEYLANDYHAPSDEIKPGWDFSGGVDDL
ncbi:MAG TPA: M20/M25/M40 family metallo-hydrolase, partial [Gemmatimonadales bacterium]|nr:M20/M25/M40 family metallo-hydrolase [Gemmatimonadales bacterium]